MLKLIGLLILVAVGAFGQSNSISLVTSTPTGACTSRKVQPRLNTSTGELSYCDGAAWQKLTGGGVCTTGSGTPTTGTAGTCYIDTSTTPRRVWIFVATDDPREYVTTTGSGPFTDEIECGTTPSAATTGFSKRFCTSGRTSFIGDDGTVYKTFTQAEVDAKATVSGTPTTGNCAKWAGPTSLEDAGAVCGSGSSFDPLDFQNPWWQGWAANDPRFDPSRAMSYSGGCTAGSGVGATGVSTTSVMPREAFATTGTTGDTCFKFMPNSSNPAYGFVFADYFSGSSPTKFKAKVRFRLIDRNGDAYFGFYTGDMNAGSTVDEFIGCAARKTDTNWQAVIIAGGVATYADTGVAVTVASGDTNDVLLEVNNGAPTANQITCKVNGTGATASRTISSGSFTYPGRLVVGVKQNGATASAWEYSWAGWQFFGVGSVN
jgi:hypothetical protein